MIDDDAVPRAVERVLPRHLHELQWTTGLPVVFGGATRSTGYGQQLTITQLVGTLGDALRLVSVLSGRGLGGAAMARLAPFRVSDYASTPGITHDCDHAVVERERLTSILAFPIRVHGAVRGVLYGAVRENRPIGDVAVRNAAVIAAKHRPPRHRTPRHRPAGPASTSGGGVLGAVRRCGSDADGPARRVGAGTRVGRSGLAGGIDDRSRAAGRAQCATFAIAFFARQVGAIVFGHCGDRIGRKRSLISTLLLMGIATQYACIILARSVSFACMMQAGSAGGYRPQVDSTPGTRR